MLTTMSALRSRVAFKQVHIQTTPAPRNLAESKLVLAALQRFGEVVTFRNLKVCAFILFFIHACVRACVHGILSGLLYL